MHECRYNQLDQGFSGRVRRDLERLSAEERCAVVSRRDASGCAPLFEASAAGNVPLLEHLVRCGAALEQRGVFRAPRARTAHRATPLWAAAVAGRAPAVAALLALGAAPDAPSDSGSTPLRSACFMSHLDVARLLLERGADVARVNHHGGTCLVNAVQSAPLCRLLLAHGAPVDARDAQLKTALHYAIQEHREETARLLLDAGADPALRTRAGDDALQLAAIKGAARLAAALAERAGPARAADALELLGATQLDVHNDARAALASWRRAAALRSTRAPPKRPSEPPAALGGAREWASAAELEARAHEPAWLRAQALLVCARVLGADHRETLARLMDRGAAEADARRDARAAALWTWALELRVARHTLLHAETAQTLVALTQLLEDAGEEPAPAEPALCPAGAALGVLRLLAGALAEAARLVEARPRCRAQAALWERTLRCATHLLRSAARPPRDPARAAAQQAACRDQARALVALEPCSVTTGDTLLHLACSRLNVVHSTYFPERNTRGLFPSARVARLLLESGACVGLRNHAGSTPLHVAAIPYNFSSEMVELLVEGGAHLDQPNRFGDRPSELVQLNRRSRVCPVRHVSLACLAARALLAGPRPPPPLPPALASFVALHAP